MMNNSDDLCVLGLLIVVFVVGIAVGCAVMEASYMSESIEMGHVEYDSKTGNWQWIEKEE